MQVKTSRISRSCGAAYWNAVRGQQAEAECFRKRDGFAGCGFFVAVEVALKLDVDVVMPEDADQTLESLMARFCSGLRLVSGPCPPPVRQMKFPARKE